ncbi:hypothetical protein AAVH_42096 [Aphelenchoides avenae]|nr:hypothetical protein AAVH_42096 [Aphelenchus avenae]
MKLTAVLLLVVTIALTAYVAHCKPDPDWSGSHGWGGHHRFGGGWGRPFGGWHGYNGGYGGWGWGRR